MTERLSRPQAILFDWDGTLVDNWPVIHEALNHTLVAMGHEPWTMSETMDRVSRSQRDSFPLIFGDRWEQARDQFYARFEALHLSALRTLPGAEDMLSALAQSGVPLGVVSNKRGDYLRREADHLGWDRFFVRIIGATDAAEDKPSAAPVHLVLESCRAEAGRDVWLVGDTGTDLQCARNAGCTSILVDGAGSSTINNGDAPDLWISELAELAKLIEAV